MDDLAPPETSAPTGRWVHPALLVSVVVIATSGLVYELIAGTLASYVLGDSVAQFSLVIGLYLFAMGVGSWLSRFVEGRLLERFVEVELGIAVLGGLSAPLLFRIYTLQGAFRPAVYVVVSLVGALVGLEIPLLLRLLKFQLDMKELVARVLSLDYVGALAAALLFPTVLLPKLGLHQTSLFFGIANAAVALFATWLFPLPPRAAARLRVLSVGTLGSLVVLFFLAGRLLERAEAVYFGAPIVYSEQSPYQRVVITQSPKTTRLFLNGNLQFSSDDEHRYHEVLVHPAVAALGRDPRRVLVLGGGDGLAVRELLRYPSVEAVDLVDLDAAVTRAFRTLPICTKLNAGALLDPRVRVHDADAYKWLEETTENFDLAVVDFPDPSNYAVGKLYTDAFYQLLRQRIGPRGVAVIQATSPQYARESFWTIVGTIESTGLHAIPLHVYVPSFGEWGFVLVGEEHLSLGAALRVDPSALRYLEPAMLGELTRFPKDMGRVDTPVHRLNDQKLVTTYAREWGVWIR